MRVRVIDERCQGHTVCNMQAPAVFGLNDDDGHVLILLDSIPDELGGVARRAVANCPERVLEIDESQSP
jgi:ferredoxin